MNPAMIIILILIAIGIWFFLARKDMFTRTEDFIDESIKMGIHNEEPIEVEINVKE